jgi:RsiW-degrading membrane proteinase PrsW (M82 family)
MSYPLLIIFALAPSTIWLLYFLRKDVHPESNRMVLKIFFYGILAAVGAILLELGFFLTTAELPFSSILISFLNVFIGVALIEEFLKFLVVKEKILSNSELDEPVDIMLYMIIAALGFVALENILIFLSPKIFLLGLGETLILVVFRFISATLLHALTSGILGYFLALSFFEIKKRVKFLVIGITLATLFHGLYNLSFTNPDLIYHYFGNIIKVEVLRFSIPTIILIALAILVSLGFKRLKKIASICKIK